MKAKTRNSSTFAAGWSTVGATAETPDLLELSLDKPGYAPGDTANLRITPQFPGIALIAVVGDGLVDMKSVEVPAEGITVPHHPTNHHYRHSTMKGIANEPHRRHD